MLREFERHLRLERGRSENTLRAYLHHDGSWSRTADALHVHVNTVRYRIGRVEALTDRDLGTTEDRTDVFVALAVLGPQPTTL